MPLVGGIDGDIADNKMGKIMTRITEKHLNGMVSRLNRITGNPAEPYAKGDDGKYIAQIGNYHIDHAYGGVQLVQMCNINGGVSSPIGCGHIPKRELYERLHAFICGIELMQNKVTA